jgi:hypothetical protein
MSLSIVAGPPLPEAPSNQREREVADAPGPSAQVLAAVEAARARSKRVADARAAASIDPDVALAEAKILLAREERAAALAEHEFATDAVYRAACLARGSEMVARIYFRDGSAVFRAETEPESYARAKLMAVHERAAAEESDPNRRAMHENNIEIQVRECFLKYLLSDRANFEAQAAKYAGVWNTVGRAMGDLASGRVLAEGKGVGA